MDKLTYAYLYSGNRLHSVTDSAATTGFYDGNTTGWDYAYDGNRNMVEDKNKGITVSYNYLNLPDTIAGNESINYIYDALGVKWLKNYDGLEHTAYYGAFVYRLNQSAYELDYILTPEGMIKRDGGGYAYRYFLKDHLGNTRVVFSDVNGDGWIDRGPTTTEILQRTDYYPFLASLKLRMALLDVVRGYAGRR